MKSNPKRKVKTEEHSILFINTIYSFITNYGTIFFQVLNTFLISKIISKNEWGFLIIALSIISIIVIISNFIPPALDYSVNFFIPKYLKSSQLNQLNEFIKKILILKSIFLIPIFLSILFLFLYGMMFFNNFLSVNFTILVILSPLIIINGFIPIFNGINRSLNMYKTIFFLLITQNGIQIFFLIFTLLFKIKLNIETIAFIYTISAIIPFLLNLFILSLKFKIFKIQKKNFFKLKNLMKETFKYGIYISFGYFIYGFWREIQIQAIGFFNCPIDVTGYNISLAYASYQELFLVSFYFPLFNSFSRLIISKNYKQIKKIFLFTIKYSQITLLLLTGILFLFSNSFLIIIYGKSYLIFNQMLQLMLIPQVFNILKSPFDSLILANNKPKFIAFIRIIEFFTYNLLFFIGLLNFGVYGAIIFLVFGKIIGFILYFLLILKILKIELRFFFLIY